MKVKKSDFEPSITILIPAYNEEASIEETLINKLALDYPKEKLEIIVISDGSTDGTEVIVNRYIADCIKLLSQEQRAGKTVAINTAVAYSSGEILVFSDANSIYAQDALRNLVRNFSDPEVGYVTGKMIYTNPDGNPIGDGCTAYIKYENFLRNFETKLGSVVGVDGGIDAVRKKLYENMVVDQLPDLVLPLKIVEQGYRVVYEPEAILKEQSLKASEDEYRMRVRVALRAFWALSDMRPLLSFKRFRLFALQLWSHKVLRYLCFIFLLCAYFANLLLWPHNGIYKVLFIIQNISYLSALISPLLQKSGYKLGIISLIHYFVLLNVASAHAFIKFLFRQKQTIWTPRKG